MPTYEYVCPNGHQFDRFQKMSDPPEADCPECGEAGERRISAGAGFLFKGDGFYITDYRSADYKAKDKAESGKAGGGASDSDSSGGGTTESPKKPAASAKTSEAPKPGAAGPKDA
jgi:putative FmdB family regulatory protein